MKEQIFRLANNSLIYGVGSFLTKFISLLLLPVFTSYLTPADYGVNAILTLIWMFLNSIFSLGFGTSIGICYYEKLGETYRATVISTAFFGLLVSITVYLIFGISFADKIGLLIFKHTEYTQLIIFSLIGTGFSILTQPYQLKLQFEEKAKTFVIVAIISSIITIGINVLLIVFLRLGLRGLIIATSLGQIVTFILFFVSSFSKTRFTVELIIIRKLLKYGLPMIPSFASLYILQQSSRLILQWLYGSDLLGIFTVGYNLGNVMMLAITAFSTAWAPFFLAYMDKKEEAGELFGRITTYYILGFGALSLLFFIFAKPVTMIMTAQAFHEAYKVIGLVACAQFVLGIFNLLLPGPYFAKEVKHVSVIQGLAALISLPVTYFIIGKYGLIGAGLGLIISNMLLVIIQFIWNHYRRIAYLPVKYDWKRIVLSGMFFIVVATTCVLWERSLSLNYELILSVILSILVLLFIWILLTGEERNTIRKLLAR